MERTRAAADLSPLKKTLLWSGLLCVLLFVSIKGIEEFGREKNQSHPGQLAPLTPTGEVGEFVLFDRSGREFSSMEYRGKIWVVNFIFTSCYGQCPLMVGQMKKLQEVFNAVPDLRLVSITCDPKVDTQEKLREFAKKHGADDDRWLFLTGEDKVIQRVARESLKLSYRPASDTELGKGAERIIHSNRFLLIDREGQIVGRYYGTEDADVKRLIQEIKILDTRAKDE